ncbi:phosphoesterase [Methanosarcinales archaeon]|nr:MAG: phosphoesterase [Methanosarcinales archaeon]
MVQISPIIDEPILVIENKTRSFIAADLHIGIEYELDQHGITIPSQTEKILKKITKHLKKVKPDQIILLGDVKHKIPYTTRQEERELPEFITELAAHAEIYILPGNHDIKIEKLLENEIDNKLCTITPTKGTIIDGIGYFHGHTWPKPELLKTKHIITAHSHPAIQLKDALGHIITEPAWIRTNLRIRPFEEHSRDEVSIRWSNPELIIAPTINHLCGGTPFNTTDHTNLLGPVLTKKAADLHNAEAYLLDGTNLGRLEKLRSLKK